MVRFDCWVALALAMMVMAVAAIVVMVMPFVLVSIVPASLLVKMINSVPPLMATVFVTCAMTVLLMCPMMVSVMMSFVTLLVTMVVLIFVLRSDRILACIGMMVRCPRFLQVHRMQWFTISSSVEIMTLAIIGVSISMERRMMISPAIVMDMVRWALRLKDVIHRTVPIRMQQLLEMDFS